MRAKTTFFSLIFFSVLLQIKAQTYVSIPDTAFVRELQNRFPSCMSGNNLDITCYDVVNTYNLDLSMNYQLGNIEDLSGIEYFTNLAYLNVWGHKVKNLPAFPPNLSDFYGGNNPIGALPVLPNTLKHLSCSSCSLTTLPSLPSGLKSLYCSGNKLSSLPNLPNGLEDLFCSGNQLTSLPVLPASLQYLECGYNQISVLPTLPTGLLALGIAANNVVNLDPFPTGLYSLNISYNPLAAIPTLPSGLLYYDCAGLNLTSLPSKLPVDLLSLGCEDNQLTYLPQLPDSLQNLWASGNLLDTLPVLPVSLTTLSVYNNLFQNFPSLPPRLTMLDVDNNFLVHLPALPRDLEILYCAENLLTDLPVLPDTMMLLMCYNNQISCFPTLPVMLLEDMMYLDGNPFKCLPNYSFGMDSLTLLIPLCVADDPVNNPYECVSAQGISGTIFRDADGNCQFAAGEAGFENIPLKLYDSANVLLKQSTSLATGVYNFQETYGTYRVEVDTVAKPYQITCAYPGSDTLISTYDSLPLAQGVDFAVECKPGFDIGVISVTPQGIVFPGQIHKMHVRAGNMAQWYNMNCVSGSGGQLVVTLNGPVKYFGVPDGAMKPTNVIGNTLYYSIGYFDALDIHQAFSVYLKTDTTARSGDQVCVDVHINLAQSDNNTANNDMTFCYSVLNSYDPNMKEVYPQQVLPGYDDFFTYTVHFQNTGTAPAFNIKVRDTLDPNLDPTTFEVISYSHRLQTSLNGANVLFYFPDIMLADSTSNEPASHGYVQYRIKPRSGLGEGSQIQNTAYIFFDYNEPVVTNTTVNDFTLGVELLKQLQARVAPNPFSESVQVQFSESVQDATLILSDIFGQEVKRIPHFTGQQLTLHRDHLADGIYFLRVGLGAVQSAPVKLMLVGNK